MNLFLLSNTLFQSRLKIRNPKSEFRSKSEYRNPKHGAAPSGNSDFEFRVCFGFRISDFGFCLVFFFCMATTLVAAPAVRLVTLDPGHFHAALFQKEMLPGIAEQVHVYAPLGPDLLAHLNRIAQFNSRKENPTRWQLEIHTGPDYLERMLAERRGNVVVISGNNRGKIDRIAAAIGAGFHVLADKPWIIEPEELPRLQAALEAAEQKGVAAFDAMTQRFEISCLLQRELVNDGDIFGKCLPGSDAEPAVSMESVHYLLKEVAGVPSLRPAWFFDIRQQGEGVADVGTHLVDLVQWILFPEQAIDYRKEITVLRGERWPTVLTPAQFQRVTGERELPEFLTPRSQREEAHSSNSALRTPHSALPRLDYFANNRVAYAVRGIRVELVIKWDFEAPPGMKDTELAIFRGSTSRVEVRQGREEEYRPEVYVVPNRAEAKAEVLRALRRKVEALQRAYPGLAIEEQSGRFRVVIPDRYRIGHEEHFALLTRRFLEYVRRPQELPVWEKPDMLAKYYVTTQGIALARKGSR